MGYKGVVSLALTMSASIWVIATFGAPGSGKSTLCRSLQAVLRRSDSKKTVYIEFDEYERRMLFKNPDFSNNNDSNNDNLSDCAFNVDVWKESRQSALLELDTVLKSEKNALNEQQLVVLIDDTLHLRSMRKEIYKLGCKCK